MISKHHNAEFTAASPGGIPEAVGDRYFGQDLFRDYQYIMDRLGLVYKDMVGQIPILSSGGVVTQGVGATLDITAGVGYAELSVQTVLSYAASIPSTQNEDIDAIRIEWTLQNDLAIPSYTPGGSVNYVKVAYDELDGNTRQRAKKSGTYVYEQSPSFVITVDTTPPTAYEVCLATFTEAAGTFTFSEYTAHRGVTIESVFFKDGSIDFEWTTGITYAVGAIVRLNNTLYRCNTAHTSGTFATNWITDGYWTPLTAAPGISEMWNASAIPEGYLVEDGSAISRTTYAELFAVIGTTYGVGDGSTTFNLPDSRGHNKRGTGTHGTEQMADGNYYAGPALGAYHDDRFQHFSLQGAYYNGGAISDSTHSDSGKVTPGYNNASGSIANIDVRPLKAYSTYGTPRQGAESRGASIATNYIIKY